MKLTVYHGEEVVKVRQATDLEELLQARNEERDTLLAEGFTEGEHGALESPKGGFSFWIGFEHSNGRNATVIVDEDKSNRP